MGKHYNYGYSYAVNPDAWHNPFSFKISHFSEPVAAPYQYCSKMNTENDIYGGTPNHPKVRPTAFMDGHVKTLTSFEYVNKTDFGNPQTGLTTWNGLSFADNGNWDLILTEY